MLMFPIDYVVQNSDFQVFEGFGCTSATTPSVLTILCIQTWPVLAASVSLFLYYRMYSICKLDPYLNH